MFDGLPPKRRIASPNGRYSILTGHPPVVEQLASQVRTSSGMTFGRARPGGGIAMMHPAFTSSRIAEPPVSRRPADRPVALSEVLDDDTGELPVRLLAYLRRLDTMEAALPSRQALYARFGKNLVVTLRRLKERGHLRLWLGSRAYCGEASALVIRLTGSHHELRTPDAPVSVRL